MSFSIFLKGIRKFFSNGECFPELLECFRRRLRLSMRFELPDHTARRQIWAALLPAQQVTPGTGLDDVATAELSGAGIRVAFLSLICATCPSACTPASVRPDP